MRKIPERSLWLGHAGDTRDSHLILSEGIEAVVELADSEPLATLPRELVRLRFPLSDDGNNPPWLLRFAAESVAALIRARVPTLVCCSAGMSRSLTIVAAALGLAERRSLADALNLIAVHGPADISPGLLRQVAQYVIPITIS